MKGNPDLHALQCRFSNERWAEMRRAAARRGMSMNALINLAITPFLEAEAKENPQLPFEAAVAGEAADDGQNKLF